jgi:hypothetical protein
MRTINNIVELGNKISIYLKIEIDKKTCVEMTGRRTFRLFSDF